MATSILRTVLALASCTALAAAAGCAYPTYSGFDDPVGADASGADSPQDQAADTPSDTADARDDGPGEAAHDAADVDASDGGDAGEDVAIEAGPCASNDDCASDPSGPFCDTASGRCGSCLPSQDFCAVGEFCSAVTLKCEVGCKDNTDCVVDQDAGKGDDASSADASPEPDGDVEASAALSCDQANHQCIGCAADSDCPLGTLCEGAACVPGCTDTHACRPGRTCCSGQCFDTDSDTLHCGDCTTACTSTAHAQARCSSGACEVASCAPGFADCDLEYANGCEVDTSSSPEHCGSCDNACHFENASASCTSGVCSMASCDLGFADCDTDPANGCEISTTTDEANCGACDVICPALPHATPSCIGSACEIGSCDSGYADCNAKASDGCETPTSSNPSNCGACGVTCSIVHASAACTGGACSIASCQAPFADCDSVVGNGCETDLTSDALRCGTCTTACTYDHAAGLCNGGSCQLGACASGWGNCNAVASDGCETNTNIEVLDCGSCGASCAAPHAQPACNNANCEVATCTPPYGDCNGTFSDGCEVDLTSNAQNCGACGKMCSYANATATCSTGQCAMGACNQGFANCDNDPATGCETNTDTNILNCGGCGVACNAVHGVPSCNAGACGIACNVGFGDCNSDLADGCETPVTNDIANCGGCGTACSVAHGTPVCSGSACQIATCTDLWRDCDGLYSNGCETQVNTSLNCGACDTPCAPAHATGSCSAGLCLVVSCDSGYDDCDGNPANGCEVNLNADVNHCGACPNKCPSTGCTPSCTAGICGCSSCPVAGTADCDGDSSNGCETTTTSDIANCGGCGVFCNAPNGAAACVNSACTVVSCAAGWADCNGQFSDGCEASLKTLTNCGACSTACALANATESCASGTCTLVACDPGFGDCDGVVANGCETNTSSSPANCGGCGTVCDSTNGTATCTAGACGITCNTGFASCDGNVANGCETNLGTSPTNCGGCGTVCDSTNGTAGCSNGACTISCDTGFGNCDANPANGCETSTSANLANCGTCGNVCSNINGAATCSDGACGIVCYSGFGNCDANPANGCESNFLTDPSHCGSCLLACNLPHAISACTAGACAIAGCTSGWADCDGLPANGCEVSIATSTANCGACGNVCGTAHGTATCTSGSCGITCDPGWGDCDGLTSNGCEVSTDTSTSNCGSCGTVCPTILHGTAACLVGVCGVGTCDTGYHESAGQCIPNVEVCGNGVDDDLDGRIDCRDSDCLTDASCAGMCMDAVSIGCDTVLAGQSTGASGSTQRIAPPAYSCSTASFPGPEYAYRFSGTTGVNVFVEAFGLGGDLALFGVNVPSGAQCAASSACATMSNVASDTSPEALGFLTETGRDYYIVVDGASAQSYRLAVQCSSPTAYTCFANRAIQPGQTITSTNALGQPNTTNNVVQYSCTTSAGYTGPEAAYIFTPTATANYRADLTNLNADCDLYILNGDNCGPTCLTSTSRSINLNKQSETVTFAGVQNTSYFIVVDGWSGNVCNFTLSLTQL